MKRTLKRILRICNDNPNLGTVGLLTTIYVSAVCVVYFIVLLRYFLYGSINFTEGALAITIVATAVALGIVLAFFLLLFVHTRNDEEVTAMYVMKLSQDSFPMSKYRKIVKTLSWKERRILRSFIADIQDGLVSIPMKDDPKMIGTQKLLKKAEERYAIKYT